MIYNVQFIFLIVMLLVVSCNTKTRHPSAEKHISPGANRQPTYHHFTKKKDQDSVYKIGSYLFEGDADLVFDFFPTGHPPARVKSKGDTLYRDSQFTILADRKKTNGVVYRRNELSYKFSQFPVKNLYKGPLAKPKLWTDPPSRGYRTMIRLACAEDSINFAGHYTIAEWGCGSMCGLMAVVDRITGRVFYSKRYIPFDSLDGHWGVKYRNDSRMIIVNSSLMEDFPGYVTDYWSIHVKLYEWRDNRFIELK